MAAEDEVQPLLEDEVQALAQSVEHGERRGVGEVAGSVGGDHVGEVEVAAARRCTLHRAQCLRACGQDAESGGQHQSLLRAAHRKVHAPFVHVELDASERADRVHEEHRGVSAAVDHLAQTGDVAGDPRRGLVVAGEDAPDFAPGVRAQGLLDAFERHSLAPSDLQHLDIEAEPLGHVDPQVGEVTEAGREQPVAGREGVGQRRFPGAGAGRRKDEDPALIRPVHLLEILEDARGQLRKLGGAVVFHGHHHGALDAVGDAGGAGDEQEVAAWNPGHRRASPFAVTPPGRARACRDRWESGRRAPPPGAAPPIRPRCCRRGAAPTRRAPWQSAPRPP